MSLPSAKPVPAGPSLDSSLALPPGWVMDLVGECTPEGGEGDGASVRVLDAERLALVSATVVGADLLAPSEFERATVRAYDAIAASVRGRRAKHPVRFWNSIPRLHARADASDGIDRYMVFNAGRFAALAAWFDGPSMTRRIATASGVGHASGDLVVHCLASETEGRPVENPRQVPAYCYSRKYGPVPPCFARATAADLGDGAPLLLVGGTSSVRGEESVCRGDLEGQVEETLVNLAALVRAAMRAPGAEAGEDVAPWLRRFRELRVYYVHDADGATIETVVRGAFPGAKRVELLRADLCRDDLLVEIEGVAEIGTVGPGARHAFGERG